MRSELDLDCDAVVVGSGIGGSSFAYGLARRGLRVVVVEKGEAITHSGPDLSPIHFIHFGRGEFVGSGSKMWGAALYRLRESDFAATAMEAGVSPAWPIGYSDLEPYYGEAEQLFKVHGSSVNDRSEPPRSTPWPHAPIPHQGPVQELVARVMTRAGVPVSYIPRGLDYDPAGQGKCVLCQHCDEYFCPRDARMDAEIAALRPAIQSGFVRLLTGTECVRVLTTADGRRATGVRVQRAGEEFTIHAPVVSLAAGMKGTPVLLWRSRTSQHPHGLGNASQTLGRNLAAHTQGWILPVKLGVQHTAFHQKTFAINEFYHGAPNWAYPTGVIQSAGYARQTSVGRRYRYFIEAALYNTFQTIVMTEGLPSQNSGYALSDEGATPLGAPTQNTATFTKLLQLAADLFRAAGYRVIRPRLFDTGWHGVGTARMGSDPKTSIVDATGRVHEVEGLYVVDASSLPTPGAVDIALTIAAVALRAAAAVAKGATGSDADAQRLGRSPRVLAGG